MRAGFIIAVMLLAFPARAAEVRIADSLPLYGESKYSSNFKHFEYVNPQAPKGGRVVLPEYGGFDNFNPFIFKGIASPAVANLTLDSLGVVPVDDFSTVYPLLAKRFEIPQDNSFIGFILDEKAHFHDGTPVTADDVIFSYKALVEKGAPLYKVYYGDVERAEKVSPRHVRFHFKKNSRNKELPLILSQMKIYSAKDWENRDFAKPTLDIPLGSGPYRLDKFVPGKYLEFKRDDAYWAKELPSRKGFFNFDRVRYDYYQDTTVTLQALFAGSIDIREEYIAKIWVTGYDNELVRQGKIIKEDLPHNQAAILQFSALIPGCPSSATGVSEKPSGWHLISIGQMTSFFTSNTNVCTVILPIRAWKRSDCRRAKSCRFWKAIANSCRKTFFQSAPAAATSNPYADEGKSAPGGKTFGRSRIWFQERCYDESENGRTADN